MSKDKLIREVCENDKLKKRKATKLMTLRELNKKGERTGNNSNAADKSQNRTRSKNWKSSLKRKKL